MLWFLYLKKKLNSSNNVKPLVWAFVFSLVFGIAIELIQQFFTKTRTADVLDVLANATGATLACLAIILLNKYNRIIDKI